MALHLYDTATRSTRAFVPLIPGAVSMYVCGATVQGLPHVGHLRAGVVFDLLANWLRESGYSVTLVRNVTDIDDKILARALAEGRPWWAVAAHYERAFSAGYEALGVGAPTIEPRATGHVTQMVRLMQRLIDSGHAYAVEGDVYFDVRSYAEYGALSGQRPDNIEPAADSDFASRKRDPRDFALWKGSKPGEPSWPTPWGEGRPGWHLECSAMATNYLGPAFDIHGGGLDLQFPHHENEIAQSRAVGDDFAQYWLHNAWVTQAGEKMSKSLGNTMVVQEVLKRIRGIELRWYLVASHYRSNIEFSDEALQESGAAFRRIENFVVRASERVGTVDPAASPMCADFAIAMDDDLGAPAAVAAIFELVTEGNRMLATGAKADPAALRGVLASVRRCLGVLGCDPLAELWTTRNAGGDEFRHAVDALVRAELDARQEARAHKDFAQADAIRNRLAAAGIAVEDTAEGPRWALAREAE